MQAMPTNREWKKHWQTPQLPSVRLGPEYAWIADALGRQAEGRAGAVRAVLREVLGKAAKPRIEIWHMHRLEKAVVVLPPTRLVGGYEDLPAVVDAARERFSTRTGHPVDNADVIRSVLWQGLLKRGEKVSKPAPMDIYTEVKRYPKLLHSELARKLAVSEKLVQRARADLDIPPLPEQVAMARRLTEREVAMALNLEMTQTGVAKLLGVSQKTISVLRKKAREKRRKSAPPKK